MAIPVARVHLTVAHAALPALLSTPPKSKMLPRLATWCVLVLPMSPPNKPAMSASKASRAEADERWDVGKSATKSPSKPGRADAVERWDVHKICRPASPSSPCSSQSSSPSRRSSCSSRASSCERWDANKKSSPTSSSSSSSSNCPKTSRASPSAARWDSNKRAINRAPSAERWDAHKKPRPPLDEEVDGCESSTGSISMKLDMSPPMEVMKQGMYAGPGFFASPDPSMLPMPSFIVRAAA